MRSALLNTQVFLPPFDKGGGAAGGIFPSLGRESADPPNPPCGRGAMDFVRPSLKWPPA